VLVENVELGDHRDLVVSTALACMKALQQQQAQLGDSPPLPRDASRRVRKLLALLDCVQQLLETEGGGTQLVISGVAKRLLAKLDVAAQEAALTSRCRQWIKRRHLSELVQTRDERFEKQ
jgi:hypothetical protein